MSLRDEVIVETLSTKRPCVVCSIREQMSPAERADLDDVLADEALVGTAIARALQRRGYAIHQDGKQIRAHRRRCVS